MPAASSRERRCSMDDFRRWKILAEAYREAWRIVCKGMGGHEHWDQTQERGAGCETCIAQHDARKHAERIVDEALAATKSEPA